ncbi:MAG: hypothetical protein ACREVJ_00365 [Gammaproteobacteria bacterium]
MTTLKLELLPEQYERLRAEAKKLGKPEEELAREWLAERVTPLMSERERATEVLRAAGLLTELGPEGKERARRSKATLEEVRAALDRAGGKPLSEVILEMRGPKE